MSAGGEMTVGLYVSPYPGSLGVRNDCQSELEAAGAKVYNLYTAERPSEGMVRGLCDAMKEIDVVYVASDAADGLPWDGGAVQVVAAALLAEAVSGGVIMKEWPTDTELAVLPDPRMGENEPASELLIRARNSNRLIIKGIDELKWRIAHAKVSN